jgi:signal transduction histidine kinase
MLVQFLAPALSILHALQSHAAHAASRPVAAAVGTAAAPPPGGFLPHGYCYLWNRPLLLTHVVSDMLIGLSYVVISLALVALVHRARRDIPFHVLFVAFGLFIVACGMTHFMEIWTLWQPVYWLSGAVKVVTAVASVTTAAVMPGAVPRVLATIRDAGLAREREIAAARTAALEERNILLAAQARELERKNQLLQDQAVELARRTEQAQGLAGEVERANHELRAALAGAEAARERAEEATRAAEAAARARGEFLAVMSHELRTPLNAVGGYAELLEMGVHGPMSDPQRAALARIQQSQRHLLALINEILNFTRLEAGQVEYDLAAVPVDAALRDAAALIAPQLEARGIAMTLAGCAPAISARADADKVRQVLLNLLSNAAKFTRSGGSVVVDCAAAGDRVHLRVRDSGIGIPADQLERIFEPFVRVDQRLTRTTEGVGLGLAISRDLARGMGGELGAESVVGTGSTFTLTLPGA